MSKEPISERDRTERLVMSHIVSIIGRKKFKVPHIDSHNYDPATRAEADSEANLISSDCGDGMHAPVFDIDHGVYCIPSSTPGNYHLYIEKKITWAQYQNILHAFEAAGIVQEGWVRTAVKDKRAYLRLPHVRKGDNP